MNAEDFYKQIMASKDLQQALEDATDSGDISGFLKANGCDATPEEFTACIAAHS